MRSSMLSRGFWWWWWWYIVGGWWWWWWAVLVTSLVRLHVPQSVVKIMDVFDSDALVDFFSVRQNTTEKQETESRHRRSYAATREGQTALWVTVKRLCMFVQVKSLTCCLRTSSSLQHKVHVVYPLPLWPVFAH